MLKTTLGAQFAPQEKRLILAFAFFKDVIQYFFAAGKSLRISDLLHEEEERLFVVLPLDGKLAGVRKLVAGKLHRHLEAIGVQVAEVIHA